MVKYEFPENFWWGSAASGPQTEGVYPGDGKGESLWDYWYEAEPEKFFNQVGPDKASRVYRKYPEDIQLMKATGHNSFRTSIQWSRFLDRDGNINPEGAEFYHSVIDCALENGFFLFNSYPIGGLLGWRVRILYLFGWCFQVSHRVVS